MAGDAGRGGEVRGGRRASTGQVAQLDGVTAGHDGSAVPGLHHEAALAREGYRAVAGADEVGRGAWAGPLVAAAVVLPPVTDDELAACLRAQLDGVRDSKLLSPARRAALCAAIVEAAVDVGVGWVAADELDRLGLGVANREALRRAVAALSVPADYLLLDAFPLPGVPLPQRPIVRGDRECLSIAAASIVAKVARDRALVRLDGGYPAYGFARHKGYGTRDHQAAILEHGPCPEHRLSFAPLRPRPPSPEES